VIPTISDIGGSSGLHAYYIIGCIATVSGPIIATVSGPIPSVAQCVSISFMYHDRRVIPKLNKQSILMYNTS